mmetsp:Transcript_20297/g.61822  ORF Transcript_20297/g.61822 Transcript_20297/m.61822 type:complete len:125 (-) Transcript_20297:173-547(-)
MKGYGTMRANSHLASATMKGCHADADDIKEQYATTWRLSRALDQRHCYQEANSSFQWQASVPECRESLFQGNDPFKAHSLKEGFGHLCAFSGLAMHVNKLGLVCRRGFFALLQLGQRNQSRQSD